MWAISVESGLLNCLMGGGEDGFWLGFGVQCAENCPICLRAHTDFVFFLFWVEETGIVWRFVTLICFWLP